MNKNDTVNICGWDIDRHELMKNIVEATAEAMMRPGITADVMLNKEDGSLSIVLREKGDYGICDNVQIPIWGSDNYEFWSPLLDWYASFDDNAPEETLRYVLGDQKVDAYLDGCEDDCERRYALEKCYYDNRFCVDQFIVEISGDVEDMLNNNIDLDSIADKVNFSYEEENDED